MTPQDLIDDLNRVRSFRDNRVLIWYCNLYIENFIKLIYKKYKNDLNFGSCSQCKKSLEPSFLLRVQELSDVGYVNTENTNDKLIRVVYQSRNTAGHELNFDEKKIIENVAKILAETKMKDPQGLLAKVFSNITIWKKLEMGVVAVVSNLYQIHEQMNNRYLKDRLIFKINEECTNIWPEIVHKDDPDYF